MGALIENTGNIKSSLSNEDVIELLKQKFDSSIIENNSIVVSFSNIMTNFLDTFNIDNYEILDNDLYVSAGNLEIHIYIDKSKITYNEFDDSFSFENDGTEICIFFLE